MPLISAIDGVLHRLIPRRNPRIAAGRPLSGLARDRRGGTTVTVGLMLPVLLGGIGIGVDVAYWYIQESRMQQAADVAAFGAAMAAQRHAAEITFVNDAADQDASAYGFQSDVVTIDAEARTVRVEITERTPLFFASLFLDSEFDIRVEATASWMAATPCVLALDPSMNSALLTDSNADIQGIGCTVQANSTSISALFSDSNSAVTADQICVGGGASTNSSATHTPTAETCPAAQDPFASMTLPTVGGCTHTNAEYDSVTTTMFPGVYCGGLTIKGNADIFFSPGLYIIQGGELFIDSNSIATGTDVSFYLTGNDGVLLFDSNSVVDLTAPTTGNYAGLLFFQNPAYGGEHRIDSNSHVSGEEDSAKTLLGSIYLPGGRLLIDSNGVIDTCPMVIANDIEVNSNALLRVRQDTETCDSMLTSAVGPARLALIR